MSRIKKEDLKFKYGEIELDILNQDNGFVPIEAREMRLDLSVKKALALAVKENLSCLLIGETGTGKTSAIRELAFLRRQGYVRANMNGYTTPDELIGSKSIKNGETYYEDGILTRAMKEGHLFVADEINATPPDVMFILHGLLDEDRRITMPNGDIIRPHKDFRFFATMNPEYEGTRSLNRAFIDRYPVIITLGTLNAKEEVDLVSVIAGIDISVVLQMRLVADMARKAYKEEKTLTYVSTRSLVQWAMLYGQGLDLKFAYELSIANKTRQDEKSAFMDFYSAVLKEAAGEPIEEFVIIGKKEIDKDKKKILALEKLTFNMQAEKTQILSELEEFKKKRVKNRDKNPQPSPQNPLKQGGGNYSVGDRVKIVDLATAKKIYAAGLALPMMQYSGFDAVITDVHIIGHFRINLDNGAYVWSSDMFE